MLSFKNFLNERSLVLLGMEFQIFAPEYLIDLDRQPRRFIYPKDGGRFDAPKMHVFTHLLRKCFAGKSKVRLRPPKSTIYGGSKWPLLTPKTAWIKIAQKRPLESTENKNDKDSNFRFG